MDDFGETQFEGNVHAEANFINKTNVDEVIQMIQDAVFTLAQRTTLYEMLEVYENSQAA